MDTVDTNRPAELGIPGRCGTTRNAVDSPARIYTPAVGHLLTHACLLSPRRSSWVIQGGSVSAMRLHEVSLLWYRSVDRLEFQVRPFTVLYGRNNSGKTNVLEAIYGVLSPSALDIELDGHTLPHGVRGPDAPDPPYGAVLVQLEPGAPFDDEALALRRSDNVRADGSVPLPESQAAFILTVGVAGLTFHDPRAYFRRLHYGFTTPGWDEATDPEFDDRFPATIVDAGPLPLPLFLDWEIENIETRVGNALMENLHTRSPFRDNLVLEEVRTAKPGRQTWRIWQFVLDHLERFSGLATQFLPDFIDGSIHAHRSECRPPGNLVLR